MARKQRLLIAVDDFDRIDEPSTAVLAALAYKAERYPLVVAVATDRQSDVSASPARRLLRSVCEPIVLDPLDEAESEALIRSVFGDVPNLQLVASRIHGLAQGNPSAIMELAQHLVTTGIARYRAGGFALPESLSDGQLPDTLLSALQQRLGRLSADARELCDILYVTDGDAPTVASYARLTAARNATRVFMALDELVAARVLVADGERYRFGQQGFLAAVAETLAPERAAALHAIAADWLDETGGDALRRAHHLLASGGGRDLEAIELIAGADLGHQHAPLSLLETALRRAEHLHVRPRTIRRLRLALVQEAQGIPDIARFQTHVRPLLDQLVRDSGLALYRELQHLPEEERLKQALARTDALYQAAPEEARGYSVMAAITELAKVGMMFHSVGLASFDIELWHPLPSLAPFAPLSPALSLVERFGEASRAWVRGQFPQSVAIYRELLARVGQPDRAGLPEATHERVRVGLHLLLGLRCAVSGDEDVEAHAQVLDADRLMRVSAWRVRQCTHLSRGDVDEARRCMRRAEVLQLQVGGEQHALGSTFAIELITLALIGDVVGLRAATERVASLADRQPGWRPIVEYGQIRLRQLQGDARGALEQLLAALELAPADRHWAFGLLATCHISLLAELGRADEACAVGRAYMTVCARVDLMASHGLQVGFALARALAQSGEYGEAVQLADDMLAGLRAFGASAVMSGVAHEARARIALAMNDAAAFEHFARLCGNDFNRGRNPVLAARFARLLDDARSATTASIIPTPGLAALTSDYTDSEYATIYSRMEECGDRADRARCALTILLQHLESFAGYLYGVNEDGTTLLAGLPDSEPNAELEAWLAGWLAAEIANHAAEADAGNAEPQRSNTSPDGYVDRDGRRFVPVQLFGRDAHEARLVGVLVLHVDLDDYTPRASEIGSRIAAQLLEHGDVAGIVLHDIRTQTDE
jgi:tetratricopeptide (TPR) repeat protein